MTLFTIQVAGMDTLNATLQQIERTLNKMATDQATFDAALTDFLTDLETGLSTLMDKIAAAVPTIDLTSELQQLTDARTKFDAAVASVQAAAAPPAEPAT